MKEITFTEKELEQFRQICQNFKEFIKIAKDEICLEIDKWKIYYNAYSTEIKIDKWKIYYNAYSTEIEIHYDNCLIYEYYFRENVVLTYNKVEQSCFEKFEDIFFENLVH